MERLTTCSEITHETDMTKEWGYTHIYRRLAAYEDAGLTPDEIIRLRAERNALVKNLKSVLVNNDCGCLTCKYYGSAVCDEPCSFCEYNDRWQWRGMDT